MESLPTEVLVEILSHLDHNSLGVAMQVSKHWYEVIHNHDNHLWQPLCVKAQIQQIASGVDKADDSSISWKRLLQQHQLSLNRWLRGDLHRDYSSFESLPPQHMIVQPAEVWGMLLEAFC
eukprot:Colp12_sorted_trinity150504_noHs@9017